MPRRCSRCDGSCWSRGYRWSSCGCYCWCHSRGRRRRNRRRRCRGLAGTGCIASARDREAASDNDRVDTPSFTRPACIARHPPPQLGWNVQVDHGRNEALRVATPRPKPSNRAPPIGADCAIIAAHQERFGRNVLKRLSAVCAELQDATVKAKVGI
jgi:hypothetical protein